MKNFSQKLFGTLAATLICATAQAQNDECTGALPLPLGQTAFDTTSATTSPEAWACGVSVGGVSPGNDLWYQFTAPNTAQYIVDTCSNTSFDTVIEVFAGACGGLTPVSCDDQNCFNQSTVWFQATAGDSFFIRVGGWMSETGTGTLSATELMPGNCLATLFAQNNGGNTGGAVYFDVAVAQDLEINALQTNFGAALGTPVGLDVYVTPGTSQGNENDMSVWNLVGSDDGTALAAGFNVPTDIVLQTPVALTAGTWGVALVASHSTSHRYTNGDGTNQNYADGTLTIDLGSATNAPFTGAIFSPRVWNGSICYSATGPIGTNYCGPAVPNSTGSPGAISAIGSLSVAANDVTLTADQLPVGQFGYFLASESQGFFQPPSSSGFICLGGNIGRYNGNIGQGPTFSLQIDLTSIPVNPPQAVMPGDSWNFQSWYRDIGNTNNFTDGLEIVFN